MELVNVREIFKNTIRYENQQVTIGGWVRSNRNSKNFGFIVVNDGTFFEPIQVVYGDGLENYEEVCKINVGAAVIVKGQLVPTPEAKQPFEIQAAEVTVEGASTPDYPLQKKRHTFEYLRTISHLRPRTNTFEAVFRVRSLCAYAIHKFFQERDFVYVHTPLITGSDCEGAGEMFQVTTLDLKDVPKKQDKTVDYTKDFFGKPTNLTVSGAASVGAKRTSTRCLAPLYLPLSEFVNPYGRYNIRESSPAGLRLLGQYIYYDALVVHGRGDKLEGYGGKQNE